MKQGVQLNEGVCCSMPRNLKMLSFRFFFNSRLLNVLRTVQCQCAHSSRNSINKNDNDADDDNDDDDEDDDDDDDDDDKVFNIENVS